MAKKPLFRDQPSEAQYFRLHPVSEWLPEKYLEHGYANLDTFFAGIKWMTQASFVPQQIHDYCHKLGQYYESEDGQETLEVIRKARATLLAQEGFHLDMDKSLFKAAGKRSELVNRK